MVVATHSDRFRQTLVEMRAQVGGLLFLTNELQRRGRSESAKVDGRREPVEEWRGIAPRFREGAEPDGRRQHRSDILLGLEEVAQAVEES